LVIQAKDGALEFYVADTGIGIDSSLQNRIFERFYQVDNTVARQHEGTGIGLSISKAYSELLGGKIWLESTPGKGSVFYFHHS
jgi:signal transduction histidine kinase